MEAWNRNYGRPPPPTAPLSARVCANVHTMPPAGTVTMLFTDIEGSTRLARTLAGGWSDVRLGPEAVERCEAVGRAQPATRRVARACELARAGSQA